MFGQRTMLGAAVGVVITVAQFGLARAEEVSRGGAIGDTIQGATTATGSCTLPDGASQPVGAAVRGFFCDSLRID